METEGEILTIKVAPLKVYNKYRVPIRKHESEEARRKSISDSNRIRYQIKCYKEKHGEPPSPEILKEIVDNVLSIKKYKCGRKKRVRSEERTEEQIKSDYEILKEKKRQYYHKAQAIKKALKAQAVQRESSE